VPTFFARDPPVPRCGAGYDEVETIPVQVFTGGDLSGDFQESSQPCLFSDKTVRQTHGKTTINARNSGERR
jgi:hypothetical protein